jgi:hypothetical protein
MKKILSTMIAVVAMTLSTNAQLFDEEAKFFHVGIGVGSPYAYSGSDVSIPPVHASAEFAVSEKIGVGGLIGYTASKWEQTDIIGTETYSYSWKFSYIIVGARGAYHFIDSDKADVYGGVMLGYNIASASFESSSSSIKESDYSSPSVGGVAFGGFVGARYMFTEKLGGFAELGYNISWLSVGLAVKL